MGTGSGFCTGLKVGEGGMKFNKILLLTTLILPVTSYALDGDYTLVKKGGNSHSQLKIYQGDVSGKCYYEYAYGYRHSLLSEVDCRDHGVDVKSNVPEDFNPLMDFIKNNCTTPKNGMNGKLYATCNVPEDYLDKIKYEELKAKFEKEG